MIATEEQTSQQVTNSQTPDKLDMNSRKNIMKNMYSQSKRNQGIDLSYSLYDIEHAAIRTFRKYARTALTITLYMK